MANQTTSIQAVETILNATVTEFAQSSAMVHQSNNDITIYGDAQIGATAKINNPMVGYALDSWISDGDNNNGAIQQTVRDFSVDQQVGANTAITGLQKAIEIAQNPTLLKKQVAQNARVMAERIEQRCGEIATENTFMAYYNGDLPAAGNPGKLSEISTLSSVRHAYDNMSERGLQGNVDVFLDHRSTRRIVSSQLAQFTPTMNDNSVQQWVAGLGVEGMDFFKSNLLHKHQAGTIGDANIELTLTNVSADGKTLTFDAGAANHTKTVAQNDIIEFVIQNIDGVENLHPLTMGGTNAELASQKVQARVTADSAVNAAGSIVVQVVANHDKGLFPRDAANGTENGFANINRAFRTGANPDKARIIPTHIVGVMSLKDSLYLAMADLPSLAPFESSTQTIDGVSLRMGNVTNGDTRACNYYIDGLYGIYWQPESTMRICLPA